MLYNDVIIALFLQIEWLWWAHISEDNKAPIEASKLMS